MAREIWVVERNGEPTYIYKYQEMAERHLRQIQTDTPHWAEEFSAKRYTPAGEETEKP